MSSSDDPLLAVMRDIARAPAIELSTLAEPLRAGCVIGRFELVREIGRGGFGVVWEAVDSELGRRVALKTLATARLSSGGIDALKREARVVAKLAHPNLVTLHDVIVHDGSPVLVLELLEGETLEARLVRGALAIPALVDVALAIARGLARAHADGVAHLDLKPSNVFCTTQGTTKILDFGLAAIANMPGHRAGTAGYMAPEQWRGTPDARSDLFALGVVLYRGVSRELPFAAGDLRNLDRAPPALDPELAPVELSALVASLLQTDPARRPANADEVIRSLEQIAERLRADRDPTRNPYRYLDAFTEADRRWFCGRSREIAMLGRLVEQKPLVAVVGTSGAGKSSLVHAGLAASVAARGWRVIRLRPGDSLEMLDRPIDGAALVVVDQLEEVFTRIQDASSRRLFLEAVLSRARDDVRVVVSIREDFLTRLSELPALRDAVAGGMMLLGPPDREALVETLRGPARTLGVEIADDVVAAVIGGVEKELAPLPLVQVAASRLWELRDRTHGRIDATALAKLGGVGGVLATHAEEVVRELRGAGELEVARNIFRLLVTAGRTRIARRHADLIAAAAGPSAERVLGVLIAGRLLAVTTRDGVDEVELAHESLITGWTRLATWLDEDSEALRWRDRLRQAATLWKERGRPSELLWKGSTLAEARGALAGTRDDFLDASTLKSVRARRLRRGLLALAAATLIVTTIMAVVSVRESRRAAAASHREALVQRAAAAKDPLIAALILRELPAAQWPESAVPVALEVSQRAIPMARVVLGTIATTVLSSPRGDVVAVGGDKGHLLRWSSTTQLTTEDLGSPITALAENANHSRIAMSLEDGRVMLTSFTADTVNEVARTDPFNTIAWGDGWVVGITDAGKVVQIAVETHTVKTLDGPPANPEVAIAVSRDGKRIAYGSEGNVVVVSGTTTRTFTGHTDVVYAVAFIDRDRIASASADRTVRIWSTGGAPAVVLSGHTATVYQVAASPDGHKLASLAHDASARIWNVDTSSEARLVAISADPTRVAWSPDSRWLAVSDRDGTTRLVDTSRVDEPILLAASSPVPGLAFSPDGGQLATSYADGTLRLWAVADPRARHVLRGHSHIVRSVAFSPDGSELATGSLDGTVRRWRTDSGELLDTSPRDGGVIRVEYAGREIVATTTNAPDDRLVAVETLLGQHGITAAARSQDGRTLVTIIGDELAWWDVHERPRKLRARTVNAAVGLAIAPNGEVAVGTSNRIVLIAPGRPDRELRGHAGAVTALAFSPDGRRLASGANDRTARIWLIDPVLLSRELVELTTACLTSEERVRYLGEGSRAATAHACAGASPPR